MTSVACDGVESPSNCSHRVHAINLELGRLISELDGRRCAQHAIVFAHLNPTVVQTKRCEVKEPSMSRREQRAAFWVAMLRDVEAGGGSHMSHQAKCASYSRQFFCQAIKTDSLTLQIFCLATAFIR